MALLAAGIPWLSLTGLLFSLFSLVTVCCAALGGGGRGRRRGGSGGRGRTVWAIGDGLHSGLRVYRFGEVNAVDEADQLLYLLQGAVHLLLPSQDGILHFHAFTYRIAELFHLLL